MRKDKKNNLDMQYLDLKKNSENLDMIPSTWVFVIIIGGILIFLFNELTKNPTEISPFKMPNLFDKKSYITHSDIQNNRPAIVNFWASWCSGCYYEHDFLNKLSKEHHIKIFGVNFDSKSEEAQEFLATHGNPYFKVGTKVGSLKDSFHVTGIPTNFIINKDGKITREFNAINEDNIKEVLDELQK